MRPKVEFLYWADCPSHQMARELLGEVMADAGVNTRVLEIEIASESDADRHRFPGSPTIRVNGRDIDPDGAANMGTTLSCRVYRLEDGRFSPIPSEQMVRRALE